MTQMGTHPGPGYPVPPNPPAGPPSSGPPAGPPPLGPPEPTPPHGPGVVAPFPAPPRERNPRIWIGLGAAALVLILCVGGGVVGFVAYGVHQLNAASDAVDNFLTAVERQRYAAAYKMQCSAARQAQSRGEFAGQFDHGNRLVSHSLSQPESVNIGGTSAYAVPAELRYADGTEGEERFVVIPERAGGSDLAVCGVER